MVNNNLFIIGDTVALNMNNECKLFERVGIPKVEIMTEVMSRPVCFAQGLPALNSNQMLVRMYMILDVKNMKTVEKTSLKKLVGAKIGIEELFKIINKQIKGGKNERTNKVRKGN